MVQTDTNSNGLNEILIKDLTGKKKIYKSYYFWTNSCL